MKISASLNLNQQKVAIVTARFNDLITSKLSEGAKDCLVRHGLSEGNITEVFVPGAFELPIAAKKLAKTNQFDAIICLGCVIRGSTPHFDYVCSQASRGIMQVSYDFEVPTSFGLLTTDSIEQAIERAGTKMGNKGWEAAICAVEMIGVMNQLQEI